MKYTELEIAGMLQDNQNTIYALKEELESVRKEYKEFRKNVFEYNKLKAKIIKTPEQL